MHRTLKWILHGQDSEALVLSLIWQSVVVTSCNFPELV